METAWLAIDTSGESVHDVVSLSVVCVEKDFDQVDIEKMLSDQNCRLAGVIKSEKEIRIFRKNWIQQSVKEYTMIVNKLQDLDLIGDRFFLAHINKEATKLPQLYQMNRSDYEKLKELYPNTRLATDDEIKTINSFTSCMIATDYDKLKQVQFKDFRILASPDGLLVDRYYEFCRGFDESQDLLDELKSCCVNLAIAKIQSVSRETAIDLSKKLFGQQTEEAEETVNKLIKFYRDFSSGNNFEIPTIPPVHYDLEEISAVNSREE